MNLPEDCILSPDNGNLLVKNKKKEGEYSKMLKGTNVQKYDSLVIIKGETSKFNGKMYPSATVSKPFISHSAFLDWLLRITSSVVTLEFNLSLCDDLMSIYERASLAANFGLLGG